MENLQLTKEMKVLFLQILKAGEITTNDAESIKKVLTEWGFLSAPIEIVFRNFNETEKEKDNG